MYIIDQYTILQLVRFTKTSTTPCYNQYTILYLARFTKTTTTPSYIFI